MNAVASRALPWGRRSKVGPIWPLSSLFVEHHNKFSKGHPKLME
jgi:hypothetical protein